MYAADGEPLIMMEKFANLTSSMQCVDSNNQTKMTFKTKEAMDYAIASWDWVNDEETKCFVMIANHPSCGPEDQRYPYRVTDVSYNRTALTATLTSEILPWSEAAHDFDVDLGKGNVPANYGKTVQKRSFWDIFPTISYDKSVSWDITTGTEGKRYTLITDPFNEYDKLDIDCVNCFLKGSIEFAGHIAVQGFKLKELYFSASPQDVEGRIELDFALMAGIPKPGIQMQKTLFSVGIPGISIPDIFTLGPSLEYQVGFTVSAWANANFSVGLDVKLPNEAALVADLLDHSNSGAKGWDDTYVDPLLDLHDISATVQAAAFAQPVLAFGVEILNSIGYQASLSLRLPYIYADLTVGYKEGGLCKTGPNEITTGVTADAGAAVELWLQAGAIKGAQFMPDYNNKLWGVRWPFFEVCFPFEVPGLADGKTATPTATVPVTAYSSIDISDSDAKPTQSITNVYGPPPTLPTAVPAITTSAAIVVPQNAVTAATATSTSDAYTSDSYSTTSSIPSLTTSMSAEATPTTTTAPTYSNETKPTYTDSSSSTSTSISSSPYEQATTTTANTTTTTKYHHKRPKHHKTSTAAAAASSTHTCTEEEGYKATATSSVSVTTKPTAMTYPRYKYQPYGRARSSA